MGTLFHDQGLNPCSLHGNVESSPLNLQGRPRGDTFRLEKDLSAHCVGDGLEWVVVKLQGSRPTERLVGAGSLGAQVGRR